MLALNNNIFPLAKVDMSYLNTSLVQPPTFGQKVLEYISRKGKITPVLKYRHEYEPVSLVLIIVSRDAI